MVANLSGECCIKHEWEEDHLKLEVDLKGHVLVSGEVVEHSEYGQRLRFAFHTDQTVLLPFASELQALREA